MFTLNFPPSICLVRHAEGWVSAAHQWCFQSCKNWKYFQWNWFAILWAAAGPEPPLLPPEDVPVPILPRRTHTSHSSCNATFGQAGKKHLGDCAILFYTVSLIQKSGKAMQVTQHSYNSVFDVSLHKQTDESLLLWISAVHLQDYCTWDKCTIKKKQKRNPQRKALINILVLLLWAELLKDKKQAEDVSVFLVGTRPDGWSFNSLFFLLLDLLDVSKDNPFSYFVS